MEEPVTGSQVRAGRVVAGAPCVGSRSNRGWVDGDGTLVNTIFISVSVVEMVF